MLNHSAKHLLAKEWIQTRVYGRAIETLFNACCSDPLMFAVLEGNLLPSTHRGGDQRRRTRVFFSRKRKGGPQLAGARACAHLACEGGLQDMPKPLRIKPPF